MPEEGTKVTLFFPTQKEREGQAILAVVHRTNREMYGDEQNREFVTASRKKLGLYPQKLFLESVGECLKLSMEDSYGVQVDPRLLLAIIVKEGTGSFNTSFDNKAGDGGNGAETNFESDCEKTVDLLGGKIIAYIIFHGDFSKARAEAYNKGYAGIKDYDDILHYLNWETPRLSFLSKTFISGVYADDNNWNSGVRQIYSEFVYDDVTAEYTNYVKGLKQDIFENNAKKEGIKVTTKVTFKESKNGRDSQRKYNNEYTIIGVIPKI